MPTFHDDHNGGTIELVASPNGLGGAAAWRWLARILNQKPQRITSTLLLAFLRPCAHVLASRYKPQFTKLIRFLHEKYLPMLTTTTDGARGADGSGGAEERAALANLSTWLETTTKLLSHGYDPRVPAGVMDHGRATHDPRVAALQADAATPGGGGDA